MLLSRATRFLIVVSSAILVTAHAASGQSHGLADGVFTWQLQPYCTTMTLTVTQGHAGYTVEGFESQCGGADTAMITGRGTVGKDGRTTLHLDVVSDPGSSSVPMTAAIDPVSGSGNWIDGLGHKGKLVMNGTDAGPRRPQPKPKVARSGQVLAGQLTVRIPAGTGFVLVGDSFNPPLPAATPAPALEYLPEGMTSPACPGFGRVAVPGRLCVYGYNLANVGSNVGLTGGLGGGAQGQHRLYGFSLDVNSSNVANGGWFVASWAYRVP